MKYFQIIGQYQDCLVFLRCLRDWSSTDVLNLSIHDSNKSLSPKQYGFRKHHSTYMTTMQLGDKMNNAVEKNESTVEVYLDLSKAFDTIHHFRINRSIAGWAHSQRRVGVNITITLH